MEIHYTRSFIHCYVWKKGKNKLVNEYIETRASTLNYRIDYIVADFFFGGKMQIYIEHSRCTHKCAPHSPSPTHLQSKSHFYFLNSNSAFYQQIHNDALSTKYVCIPFWWKMYWKERGEKGRQTNADRNREWEMREKRWWRYNLASRYTNSIKWK